MVNPGVAALAALAVILTIGFIVLLVWAGVSAATNTNSSGGRVNFLPPCSQNTNISSLIQIPPSGFNCIQRGRPTSLYYIGQLGNKQYDYVVAPWGTIPIDVCVGFCTSLSGVTAGGGSCSGPNFNGQSAQANFDHCMTQLSSTTCAPPIPIAAKGTILYYAFSPTCLICDGCHQSKG